MLEGTIWPQSNGLAPWLRWAGGKRWLVPRLRPWLRELAITEYREPFVGGGAIFFGLLPGVPSVLSDANEELIRTYATVRDAPRAVGAGLARLSNDESTYYSQRECKPQTEVDAAVRFIYLNHTSFNGIYRVNLRGEYNVPFGRRRHLAMPTAENLENVSQALQLATLTSGDFETIVRQAPEKSLVFLDPPYTVAHNNNGFVKYNQKLFSWQDQERLSEAIDTVRAVGAYYILTNADHDSIAELFEKGDSRIRTSRRNSIGGASASRGTATEYLFTNIPGVGHE